MKLTDEQIDDLIKNFRLASITWGEDANHLTTKTWKALLELKELRSKPLCVVPSDKEIREQAIRYATIMGNDFIYDDEELVREQVEYDLNDGFVSGAKWIKSKLTPITPTQWNKIREALEDSKERMELSHDPDEDGPDDLISVIDRALELMDSIHQEISKNG
jgi:hypothetical protein